MIFVQRNDILMRRVNDEFLLMDNHAMCIHQLNPTASYIWSLCDGSTSEDEIIEQLALDYHIDKHVAKKEVKELITQLQELNVLIPVQIACTNN